MDQRQKTHSEKYLAVAALSVFGCVALASAVLIFIQQKSSEAPSSNNVATATRDSKPDHAMRMRIVATLAGATSSDYSETAAAARLRVLEGMTQAK